MAELSRRLAVVVDPDRCVGSGMCVAMAGDVFELPIGAQHARVVDPAAAPPAAVVEAAESCPTMAITVRDAESGAVLFPFDDLRT